MDLYDDTPEVVGAGENDEKVKKRVTIDDKNDIKFINVENEKEEPKQKSEFIRNLELIGWPWKISGTVFLIGLLFHVIAFGTPDWLNTFDASGNDVMHVGIWSACVLISNCTFRSETSTCLNAVRTFGGLGVVCCLVVLVLLVCYIRNEAGRRGISRGVVANCFVAALAIQIESSLFWRSGACAYSDITGATTKQWAWSIALSFVSVVLILAAGLSFLAIELISISREKNKARPWKGKGFNIT
ncbi:hypothetical protein MAR_031417 [Mya arenaria]|uniref:Transmembrane protein n=1 Tax=Mya arenaria TaxID=6604 RepID=A0ABY7F808_MYAAR|nr:uncharacterized protein LOC128205755 [Mya arenaria]WAR16823.1 hypothetical protein MAR_031417 [Mya arenaria]